jgi:hypothetical protein
MQARNALHDRIGRNWGALKHGYLAHSFRYPFQDFMIEIWDRTYIRNDYESTSILKRTSHNVKNVLTSKLGPYDTGVF